MCTDLEDSDNIFSALEVGATGYIVKNTTPEKMITAIKEIHAGGSPMSPQIARKVTQAFKKDKINSAQVESLTPLEKETLDLLSKGYHYKEIAEKHEVSVDTVRKRIGISTKNYKFTTRRMLSINFTQKPKAERMRTPTFMYLQQLKINRYFVALN